MKNRKNKEGNTGKSSFSTALDRSKPSAFESEIPPLHKSAIYDKRVFRPPGARKREGVMTWHGILL